MFLTVCEQQFTISIDLFPLTVSQHLVLDQKVKSISLRYLRFVKLESDLNRENLTTVGRICNFAGFKEIFTFQLKPRFALFEVSAIIKSQKIWY